MARQKKRRTTTPRGNAVVNNSSAAGKRSEQSARTAVQTAPPDKPEIAVKESKDLVIVTIKFHGDKNGGHNHVIVEDIDDKHVSVGLTTRKKKGKNHPNLPLEQSPLGDGKESRVRRQGTVAPKKEYKAPRKGKMTQDDYTKVKGIADKAKKKYLENKATKK